MQLTDALIKSETVLGLVDLSGDTIELSDLKDGADPDQLRVEAGHAARILAACPDADAYPYALVRTPEFTQIVLNAAQLAVIGTKKMNFGLVLAQLQNSMAREGLTAPMQPELVFEDVGHAGIWAFATRVERTEIPRRFTIDMDSGTEEIVVAGGRIVAEPDDCDILTLVERMLDSARQKNHLRYTLSPADAQSDSGTSISPRDVLFAAASETVDAADWVFENPVWPAAIPNDSSVNDILTHFQVAGAISAITTDVTLRKQCSVTMLLPNKRVGLSVKINAENQVIVTK